LPGAAGFSAKANQAAFIASASVRSKCLSDEMLNHVSRL